MSSILFFYISIVVVAAGGFGLLGVFLSLIETAQAKQNKLNKLQNIKRNKRAMELYVAGWLWEDMIRISNEEFPQIKL